MVTKVSTIPFSKAALDRLGLECYSMIVGPSGFVAIIGAGPAGLSAACELSKRGRTATVLGAHYNLREVNVDAEYHEAGDEITEDELQAPDPAQPPGPRALASSAGDWEGLPRQA